jgi:hypothetical protein
VRLNRITAAAIKIVREPVRIRPFVGTGLQLYLATNARNRHFLINADERRKSQVSRCAKELQRKSRGEVPAFRYHFQQEVICMIIKIRLVLSFIGTAEVLIRWKRR